MNPFSIIAQMLEKGELQYWLQLIMYDDGQKFSRLAIDCHLAVGDGGIKVQGISRI